MEPDLFDHQKPAPPLLGDCGSGAGMRDSASDCVDRCGSNEVVGTLIKAWLPLKRQRKIMRARSAVGKRTVKLLREKGDLVLVQVFRSKSGWSRGEWIARKLTDLE